MRNKERRYHISSYLILAKKTQNLVPPKKPIYSTYMYNCKVGGVEGECVWGGGDVNLSIYRPVQRRL